MGEFEAMYVAPDWYVDMLLERVRAEIDEPNEDDEEWG